MIQSKEQFSDRSGAGDTRDAALYGCEVFIKHGFIQVEKIRPIHYIPPKVLFHKREQKILGQRKKNEEAVWMKIERVVRT